MKLWKTLFLLWGLAIVLTPSGVLGGPRPPKDTPLHNLPGFQVPERELLGIAPRTNSNRDGVDSLRWQAVHHHVSPLGHNVEFQYNSELEDGVINAELDQNIEHIECDALTEDSSSPPKTFEVTVTVKNPTEPTLAEWQDGDVLVAGPAWGCSFHADKRRQPVYLKIHSIAKPAEEPTHIVLTVSRASLMEVFRHLDMNVMTNAVTQPPSTTESSTSDLSHESEQGSSRKLRQDGLEDASYIERAKAQSLFSWLWDGAKDVYHDVKSVAQGVYDVGKVLAGGTVTFDHTRTLSLQWNTDDGENAKQQFNLDSADIETEESLSCSDCFFSVQTSFGAQLVISDRKIKTAFVGLQNGEFSGSAGIGVSGSVQVQFQKLLTTVKDFPSLDFVIGAIPITVSFTMPINMEVDLNADMEMSTTAKVQGQIIKLGIQYLDGEFHSVNNKSFSHSGGPLLESVDITANLGLSFSLGAEIEHLLLAGVEITPRLGITTEWVFEEDAENCFRYNANLAVDLGVFAQICVEFGGKIYFSTKKWEKNLDTLGPFHLPLGGGQCSYEARRTAKDPVLHLSSKAAGTWQHYEWDSDLDAANYLPSVKDADNNSGGIIAEIASSATQVSKSLENSLSTSSASTPLCQRPTVLEVGSPICGFLRPGSQVCNPPDSITFHTYMISTFLERIAKNRGPKCFQKLNYLFCKAYFQPTMDNSNQIPFDSCTSALEVCQYGRQQATSVCQGFASTRLPGVQTRKLYHSSEKLRAHSAENSESNQPPSTSPQQEGICIPTSSIPRKEISFCADHLLEHSQQEQGVWFFSSVFRSLKQADRLAKHMNSTEYASLTSSSKSNAFKKVLKSDGKFVPTLSCSVFLPACKPTNPTQPKSQMLPLCSDYCPSLAASDDPEVQKTAQTMCNSPQLSPYVGDENSSFEQGSCAVSRAQAQLLKSQEGNAHQTSSSPNIAVILASVFGAVGGVALIGLIIVVVVVVRRRKQRNASKHEKPLHAARDADSVEPAGGYLPFRSSTPERGHV